MGVLNPFQFEPRSYDPERDVLYHGTGAVLKPADVVNPGFHPKIAGGQAAFATPDIDLAKRFARQDDGPGHVYEVHPLDPEETWLQQMSNGRPGVMSIEAVSTKGFRVARRMPSRKRR